MIRNPLDKFLDTAGRLEQLGVEIRSVELFEEAKRRQEFHANGGNRAMRRWAAKQARRKR